MNKKTIRGNVANFDEILMTLPICSWIAAFVIKL